jgi:DHA1 family bicyclomycin/chloramphenicol resistance-like MFS transporter
LNPQQTPLGLTVLLGVLVALPALGTDLYVPALPEVSRSLAAPVGATQATLTTYFIGLACGQIVWGPLSDRFGRKPVLAAGLVTLLLSSLIAAAADTVAAIAAARVGQGLGASSGALIGRTIVRDLYSHEAAARLLARITVVFSVVPVAAPLAGALLLQAGSWPSIFLAIGGVAVMLLVAVWRLQETAPSERRSIHPARIAATFAAILGDRRFIAPFLLILCAQAGILAWVSNSSFTLVRGLGVSVVAFGLMFAGVMLGQIGGAWSSSRLVMRLGIARLLRVGTTMMMAAGVFAAALAWGGAAHWLAVVVPFALFLFGTAIIMPNAIAAALTPFPHAAGSATSLIGAIGFGSGALISTLLGAVFDGSARPMATLAAVAGIAAFILNRWKPSTP